MWFACKYRVCGIFSFINYILTLFKRIKLLKLRIKFFDFSHVALQLTNQIEPEERHPTRIKINFYHFQCFKRNCDFSSAWLYLLHPTHIFIFCIFFVPFCWQCGGNVQFTIQKISSFLTKCRNKKHFTKESLGTAYTLYISEICCSIIGGKLHY